MSSQQAIYLFYNPVTRTLERDPSVPSSLPLGNPSRPLPVFGGRTPFTNKVVSIRQQLLEGKAADACQWNLKLVSEVDGGAALLRARSRFPVLVWGGLIRPQLSSLPHNSNL
jgi:hypothetical protein